MKESSTVITTHPPPENHRQYNPRFIHHRHRHRHRHRPVQGSSYYSDYLNFPNRNMLNYHLPPPPLPVYGYIDYQNPIMLDQTLIYDSSPPPPPPPPPYTFIVTPQQCPYTDFVNDDYYYTTRHPRTNHERRRRNIEASSVVDGSSDWDQELMNGPLSNIIARISINELEEEGSALLDEFMELAFPEEFGGQSNDDSHENLLSEESILESLNTIKYYQAATEQVEAEICVVCQCECENEELLGILGCGHQYHVNCIKSWLMINNVCPVCKRPAIQPH